MIFNNKVELTFAHIADAFRGVSDKPSPIAFARGCNVFICLTHPCLRRRPPLQSIYIMFTFIFKMPFMKLTHI